MNIIANRERPVPVHGSGTAVCQAEHSLCGYEARIALFINVLRPGDTPEKKCGRSHGVGWRRSPPIIPETRQLPVALCVLEAVGMAGGGRGRGKTNVKLMHSSIPTFRPREPRRQPSQKQPYKTTLGQHRARSCSAGAGRPSRPAQDLAPHDGVRWPLLKYSQGWRPQTDLSLNLSGLQASLSLARTMRLNAHPLCLGDRHVGRHGRKDKGLKSESCRHLHGVKRMPLGHVLNKEVAFSIYSPQ